MTRQNATMLASIVVLAWLALACTCNVGGPQAQVNCQGTGEQFVCTVAHTGGGAGQVCWDIKLTCANGTISTANQCVQLAVGETKTQNVPLSQFANHAACDSVSNTEIVNRGGGT